MKTTATKRTTAAIGEGWCYSVIMVYPIYIKETNHRVLSQITKVLWWEQQ